MEEFSKDSLNTLIPQKSILLLANLDFKLWQDNTQDHLEPRIWGSFGLVSDYDNNDIVTISHTVAAFSEFNS